MIEHKWFGVTPEGRHIRVFTLTNPGGMEVRVAEYGGIIVSIKVPDRDGALANVVLGFPTLAAYVNDTTSVGAVVGRYANRIAGARFILGGRTYRLAANDGANHLHGGVRGFNKVTWQAEAFQESDRVGVTLRYDSPDGEEGYPGTLAARVRYTLTDDNSLECDLHATCGAATHVNFTQHSYFNLAGSGDVLDHVLQLHATRYTPVDANLIPTGELRDVKGTAFDFTAPRVIGGEYDLNWVIDRDGPGLKPAATLRDPVSGRTLEVLTTQPGIQVYSGKRTAVALEPQHFPDSPNHPHFPTTLLSPGEEYRHRIVYCFSSST